MPGKYDVAGIGNAIVDVIAAVDDSFLLTHNIAKGVMTLIDEYRAEQLFGAFPQTREIAGGSAANTMVGLASLGGTGLFIGKVKDDRLGQSFAASLKDTGTHYTTRFAASGPATACCLIAVTPEGQRSMNTFLGASRELKPADIDERAVAAASVLYIEGYQWDAPEAKAAITKAMTAVKKAGGKVALTLSDPFCVGRNREEFLELYHTQVDMLFANEDEAKALFEVDEFDEALQAVKQWKGTAALTRSAKGCVVVQGNDVHVIDAVPVPRVIDTTGAGDQFAAGFLYGLSRGKHLADCGRLGVIAAGEVITHYGARPETPLNVLAAAAGLA
ncbi:MAG TPA: adenosine kinase [Rhizomicrobium sp.]|nr:adenosine kinase [Rhizomicrobium sp.]